MDLNHLPSALICATRDAAELVIRNDPAQFNAVLDELKARKWASYRRLILHLCRIFDQAGEAAVQFRDLKVLDNPSTRHEAVLLLKQNFPRLPGPVLTGVLEWIERGPDRQGVGNWLGAEAPKQDVEDFCDRRQRDWLAVLAGNLPEPWEEKLAELIIRFGPPQSLATVPCEVSWVGPTSPISPEQFDKMSVQEVLNYLKNWPPPQGSLEPTPEGFGRALTGVIAAKPAEYAKHATAFRDVDPTYVRSLFHGLGEALKGKIVFDWGPALQLAKWVISQPRQVPGRSGQSMDMDPDWGWTRNAIVNLLAEGFSNTPGAIPFQEREQTWAILLPLTDDPDPTPEHEEKYGGKNMDPATMSINTVRGNAFHTLVHYAMWVRRSLDSLVPENAKLSRSFDVMPEVREVLDAHLDLTNEPSLAIRSVYGRWFQCLAGLDWNWTCANLSRIFLREKSETARFWAAWESFIVFSGPNTALLTVLLPCYQHAVLQLDSVENLMKHPATSDDRLGEHLVIYYWLDKLQLESKDGLVRDFFSHASEHARAHLMWFVGRSVSYWEETVPASVYERLRALFEHRLAAAKATPTAASFEKELSNFGFWFVSGKFDERWCLDTLISVLKLTGKIEFKREVTKHLSELCAQFPLECVKALRAMIDGSKEPWIILALGDEAKQLLESAMHSGNPEAVFAARRMTEDLIANRHFDFRKLLE